MRATKQARRQGRKLLQLCCVNGVLDEARIREVLRQFVASKPRGYLATLMHFRRLVKLEVQRRTARVETAKALPAALQGQVQSSLARVYGPLSALFAEKPDLIGGMRIQVGSDVYDGSVHGRLKRLKQALDGDHEGNNHL